MMFYRNKEARRGNVVIMICSSDTQYILYNMLNNVYSESYIPHTNVRHSTRWEELV